MKLTAIYKVDGETRRMEMDSYNSKKAFADDLAGNGFTVQSIYSEKDLLAQNYGFEYFRRLATEAKALKSIGVEDSLIVEVYDANK